MSGIFYIHVNLRLYDLKSFIIIKLSSWKTFSIYVYIYSFFYTYIHIFFFKLPTTKPVPRCSTINLNQPRREKETRERVYSLLFRNVIKRKSEKKKWGKNESYSDIISLHIYLYIHEYIQPNTYILWLQFQHSSKFKNNIFHWSFSSWIFFFEWRKKNSLCLKLLGIIYITSIYLIFNNNWIFLLYIMSLKKIFIIFFCTILKYKILCITINSPSFFFFFTILKRNIKWHFTRRCYSWHSSTLNV